MTLVVAACDPVAGPAAVTPGPRPATASVEPFDVGPVKTAAQYLAEPRFAAGDLARGELLSLACSACHTLRAGDPHNVGPNLHGVFGRPAASLSGFAYSEALQSSRLVWTPIALEAWLTEPASFVPGTTMAFSGYREPDDRRDLLAYLLRATQ
jgi:cytochrome c